MAVAAADVDVVAVDNVATVDDVATVDVDEVMVNVDEARVHVDVDVATLEKVDREEVDKEMVVKCPFNVGC